ncbi:MAG: hypothetical protein JO022_10955, partial [Acidobacteriaceae bacterium]|nr:hypothetical protein [Acidobacteriaceae bacterium]
MKCHGTNAISGETVEIAFNDPGTGGLISHVDSLLNPAGDEPFVSPGFIDLQVNGFAGVDYCSPAAPLPEIARSIRAMFATGVTRFFPTVITGSPDNMAGALANLAKARRTLPEGAAIEAFHAEGPFISPEDGPRGAHPQRWVRP